MGRRPKTFGNANPDLVLPALTTGSQLPSRDLDNDLFQMTVD
jgi:hypothetical protein